MNSPEDNSESVPKKAARWVSPWDLDESWELEQKRAGKYDPAKAPAAPAKLGEAAQPAAEAKQPKVVSVFEEKKHQVTNPSKSFADFGSFSPVTAPPVVTKVEPVQIQAAPLDVARFQPPAAAIEITAVKRPPTPVSMPKPQAPPEKITPEPQSQPPPRRPAAVPRSLGKHSETATSWGTAIVLCLGMLGFVLLAWIYLTDAKTESDEDLHIQTPVDQTPKIAAPERMRTFLNAVKKIENFELAKTPAWKWDTQALAGYINSNSAVFDNLRDLLEDFDWHPSHAAWHNEDLGDHPAWPHVRILLQAHAAYMLRNGTEEAAFTTAIDIAEMSRRMQEIWAWPSFMTRAQELHMACVQTTAELLKNTRLSSARLRDFQDEFILCEPSDTVLQSSLRAFYIHEKTLLFGESSGVPLDTLPRGITQERPARLFFKKNETLSLFADVFRQLRNEIVVAPYAALGPESPSVQHVRNTRTFALQPNGAGEAYFSDRIDPYLDMPARHSLAKARHSLVSCLFAIRRYTADRHQLPSGLADLRPNYLLDIPIDPYSGESLHYNPLAGLLFSVGVNLVQEGGKVTHPPLLDPTEPTVELGIAVATPVPVPK